MEPSRLALPTLLVTLLLAAAGCGKGDSHADHAPAGGHAHTAPHGGKLLELGEHAGNIEVVRDPAAGKITIYLLDGHAENFVRIAAPAVDLIAYAGGEKRALSLKAVANAATGETVGNTSQFEGQAEWLKKSGEINGEIGPVEVRGTKFPPVAFQLK